MIIIMIIRHAVSAAESSFKFNMTFKSTDFEDVLRNC